MKKVSLPSIIALILVIISMAMIMIGAQRQNTVLAISGLALGFAGIIGGSFASSVIKINKRFPLRDDPAQKKIRAAKYLSLAASIVITVGAITAFVGVFMESFGIQLLLRIAWVILPIGFVMAIAGSVLSAVMSHKMSGLQEFSSAVPPPSTVVSQIPYSPDPVISQILANPYVLNDERIKQIPQIQNLMQYPEIQQIFFDPQKLYTLFDQPRVRDLLNIVKNWITDNNAEDIFAAAAARRPANTPQAVTAQTVKSEEPAFPKKGAKIFVILFIVFWLFVSFVSIKGNQSV